VSGERARGRLHILTEEIVSAEEKSPI